MFQFQTRCLEGLQLQVKRLAPVLSRAICTNSRWWQFRKWDVKGNVVCSVLRKAGGLNAVQMWGLGCAVKQVMTCRRPYSPPLHRSSSTSTSSSSCTSPNINCTLYTVYYTVHTVHSSCVHWWSFAMKWYGFKLFNWAGVNIMLKRKKFSSLSDVKETVIVRKQGGQVKTTHPPPK